MKRSSKFPSAEQGTAEFWSKMVDRSAPLIPSTMQLLLALGLKLHVIVSEVSVVGRYRRSTGGGLYLRHCSP